MQAWTRSILLSFVVAVTAPGLANPSSIDLPRLKRAHREGERLPATVVKMKHDKLIVALGAGLRGAVPLRELTKAHRAELPKLEGKNLVLVITKMDGRGKNVVLSETKVADKQRRRAAKTLQGLVVGDRVRGRVLQLFDQGALLDVGGLDGQLPIAEMSWSPVEHPSKLLSLGEERELVVLTLDRATKPPRLELGLKQLEKPAADGRGGPGGGPASVIDDIAELSTSLRASLSVLLTMAEEKRYLEDEVRLGRRLASSLKERTDRLAASQRVKSTATKKPAVAAPATEARDLVTTILASLERPETEWSKTGLEEDKERLDKLDALLVELRTPQE